MKKNRSAKDFSAFCFAPSSLIGVLPFLVAALLVVGCSSTSRPAPVIDRAAEAKKPAAKPAAKQTDWRPQFYTVQKGDTLFSIALEHGLDYKELAEWNGIENPNVIRRGQQLRLSPPSSAVTTAPFKAPPAVEGRPVGNTDTLKTQPKSVKLPYSEQALAQLQQPEESHASAPQKAAKTEAKSQPEDSGDDAEERIDWGWPVLGRLVAGFSEGAKGVDIAGKLGQPVLASAPGKVVYSGSGLRGYGKLVIIKHNKTYLTAYAHNNQVLVKEGQAVAKGQKIAEMGNSDTDQVKLHFEIRRLGKPVDPLKYLPSIS